MCRKRTDMFDEACDDEGTGMVNKFLYCFGLAIALLFIAFSLDDLFWDLYYYFTRHDKINSRLRFKDLDNVPARLLAVMIPAWNEAEVIGPMVENLIQSVNYPSSLFHIFLGIYPNDPATRRAVETLAEKYPNVHPVVNPSLGPTSKAQNLNHILESVLKFEQEKRMRFAVFVIHDAEDVVHPTSFKLANYLTYKYDVVQLPVFPLQPYPTRHSFLKFITAATYADEFAENHYRALPAREASGALVPSAGTGYIISRRALERLGRHKVFEEDSITEDYRLSLHFKEHGIHTHFFIEGVQRVLDDGKVVTEYVATREIFPNTFREAVRQKSRWIYGISFQSFSLIKIFRSKNLSAVTKYSLYRDWKAKFGNLLTLPGYAVFAYTLVCLFNPLPVVYPVGTLSWQLSIVLTIMMVERQIMRFIAIKNVYGWRSAVFGCLIPPLFPLRMVWGNIINFFATLYAWRIALFGFPKSRPRWQKTKHSYLAPEVLVRYRRRLGDLILEKELLEPVVLARVLEEAKGTGERLGTVLTRRGIVPQAELAKSLSEVLKMGYVRMDKHSIGLEHPAPELIEMLKKYNTVPVVLTASSVVMAVQEPLSEEAVREISSWFDGKKITIVLASASDIAAALASLENPLRRAANRRLGERLVEAGIITSEQLIEALRVQELCQKSVGEILVEMGILLEEDLERILRMSESAQDTHAVQVASTKEEGNI